MKKHLITLILLQCCFANLLEANPSPDVQNYKVAQKEYAALLKVLPVLMETGGAKIVEKPDGSRWFVSIGVTIIKSDSARDLLRRRTVATAKARANAVSYLATEVSTKLVIDDKSSISIKDGKESGHAEEEMSETTITQAKGIIRGMAQVATWTSKDGKLYFVALGKKVK